MSDAPNRNRLLKTEVLLEGWSRVVRLHYQQTNRDGTVLQQDRDLLDRGHGVTVLLYNRLRRTVLLLRQPRVIATVHGLDGGETLEACNGLMESEDPEACAMRELEEEAGHRPRSLQLAGTFYASPGSSLELVHVYLAEYDEETRIEGRGGGVAAEGEDIELVEVPIQVAAGWLRTGRLADARTCLALSHLLLFHLTDDFESSKVRIG